jgi:hypothetical protein
MARDWKSRQPPVKTSLTEIARRYHACAVALATSLGIPLADALRDHHTSITAIFIEASRCELRLPAGVTLPPLMASPPPRPRALPTPRWSRATGHFGPTEVRTCRRSTATAVSRPRFAFPKMTPGP